ncbi:hypothetical protein KFK09_011835 [Dendrobium nobile]|uniref:Uncharacterized protein n=1 Tax=Dendrobium nobile TaxID=94219 RepID=A0A8T3BG04_DENNO|nr:hypothetical protein KFK09_011835 [Dendrobium nobile]
MEQKLLFLVFLLLAGDEPKLELRYGDRRRAFSSHDFSLLLSLLLRVSFELA